MAVVVVVVAQSIFGMQCEAGLVLVVDTCWLVWWAGWLDLMASGSGMRSGRVLVRSLNPGSGHQRCGSAQLARTVW